MDIGRVGPSRCAWHRWGSWLGLILHHKQSGDSRSYRSFEPNHGPILKSWQPSYNRNDVRTLASSFPTLVKVITRTAGSAIGQSVCCPTSLPRKALELVQVQQSPTITTSHSADCDKSAAHEVGQA
jgi:hypothetical protein